MGAKQFDYYIFIDYSDNLIGYLIIEGNKTNSLLEKIKRFKHYREAEDKKLYLKNVKQTFKRERLLELCLKYRLEFIRNNIEIFLDIGEFIKKNENCLIFTSVDNRQYDSFKKFVKIVDGHNIVIIKESELKNGAKEYKLSLILDNWLNIERRNDENN